MVVVMRVRRFAALTMGVALMTAVPACGGSAGANGTLTLYAAQHQELIKPMVEAFEKETNIKVNIRMGGDSQLANQIVQEGASSPGDVFVTENSPAMSLVDHAGRLARLDDA